MIDLADQSDTQVKGDRHTVLKQVDLAGTTEPGALITISGTSIVALSDQTGQFTLEDVPLDVGENTFTFDLVDRAGNVSAQTFTCYRDNRPQVTAALLNDTPIQGGDGQDGVTSDSAMTGLLFGPSPVVRLLAGLDRMATDKFVDVSQYIDGDSYTLSQAIMERVNGAPLSVGTHTLRIVAVDDQGRSSEEQTFTFQYDPGAVVDLQGTAERSAASGLYTYAYTLSNATPAASTSADWTLRGFSVPIEPGTTLSDITSPPGWSHDYDPGDTLIRWTPDTAAAALARGESAQFGFRSATRLGPASCQITVRDTLGGETRTQHSVNFGPVDGTGAALYDRFGVAAGAIVSDNVLLNDLGTGLTVTAVDHLGNWPVDFQCSPNGTFTYDASAGAFTSSGSTRRSPTASSTPSATAARPTLTSPSAAPTTRPKPKTTWPTRQTPNPCMSCTSTQMKRWKSPSICCSTTIPTRM